MKLRTIIPALALVLASCGKSGKGGGDAAIVETAQEPPVAVPDGLLADIYATTPDAAWTRLQRGVGGALGILPATLAGVLCSMSGLEVRVAGEVDGASPMYGVLAGDVAAPAWAIAMKLTDARKTRASLTDGEQARYTARESGTMTELVANGGRGDVVLGLTRGGYLIVARSVEDLRSLGPYAARTLPSRPLPMGALVVDVPHSAIASAVKPRLDAAWSEGKSSLLANDEKLRKRHGGRAPDYGDPQAIVAAVDGFVVRKLAVLGDLERLKIAVDVGSDNLHVTATMQPAAGGGPASKWTSAMKTGDSAPLLALPASSVVSVLIREGEEERVAVARELEAGLKTSLGARLAENDAKVVHDTVESWTKASGDTLALSFGWDEPRGIFAQLPTRDTEAATRALRGVVDVAQAKPFRDILHVRGLATSTAEIAGIGAVTVATLAREAPQGAAPAGNLGLAWAVDGAGDAGPSGKVLSIAAGPEPVVTLRAGRRPERRLGDEDAVRRVLLGGAAGSDAGAAATEAASLVLVAQPFRLDPKRAPLPAAPVTVVVGRKDSLPFITVDVADALLREATRQQMGL